RTRLYGPAAKGRFDGEYLDSLEGYVTAELNFRRDHFGPSTVPLTFAADTHRPALSKGMAIHEFTRWLSDDVHRLGGLVFANSVPYRFSFLCPWLDVMGTETDWLVDGVYRPVADAQLCLWRTMSGGKPYLLLMNTDYERFTTNLVERYFQHALFYGMFPSMFSHNAAENPYWQNPKWYHRDRALFKKYLPLIKQVAEAGWEPVTGADCDNPSILIERFGAGTDDGLYFTLRNDTAMTQSGALRLSLPVAARVSPAGVTELLSGKRLTELADGWPVELAAGTTAVLHVEPGPRFVGVDARAVGRIQLIISSPPGLEPVLERSDDLSEWFAVSTNNPSAALFTVEVAMAGEPASRYFRLRW
ncbi:MAG: hypothetical protein ACYDC1_24270, partial [Limisphaerales bacterium]